MNQILSNWEIREDKKKLILSIVRWACCTCQRELSILMYSNVTFIPNNLNTFKHYMTFDKLIFILYVS